MVPTEALVIKGRRWGFLCEAEVMDKSRRRMTRTVAVAAAGGELVCAVTAGVLFGRWLDHRFGTTPWLTAGGVLVGFTLGTWALYRAVTQE